MDRNAFVKECADRCAICQGPLEGIINLPALPLTGMFSSSGYDQRFPTFDQEFLFCNTCGHGQLRWAVEPGCLYGAEYSFRTANSRSASRGTQFFADYLESLFHGRIFSRIVEFGCNDGSLLQLLKKKGEKLFGVDLIWSGKENEFIDEKIRMVGASIDEINFLDTTGGVPDLILSQHTLEHLEDPRGLLESLFNLGNSDTVFLFEFPCLNLLLDSYRFDQIFHQHLHYFSVESFFYMLARLGAEVIDFTFQSSHWGGLVVAFRKVGKQGNSHGRCHHKYPICTVAAIRERFNLFRRQMENAAQIIDRVGTGNLYGYGAALMLPVLGYHLGVNFSRFQAILDDDPAKDQLWFKNLPVVVHKPAEDFSFSDTVICLTSLCNR
ncbi:MAG: methyltransferase domain-containing protein, partial [Desulfobulbaceae bacterium]|nr:methyltransferase domain-containing protein [Desulfobulbaceae bacterium]